jgi:mycothiol synthase
MAMIRDVKDSDAAGVRAVSAASLPFEPDAADLARLVATAPGTRVGLVAEEAGRITGIAFAGLGVGTGRALNGYVDLLAVTPEARGHGTGAALLSAAEDRLRSAGAAVICLGGNAPVFAWPGVDPRYTAMTCLAEQAGYRRCGEAPNMIVDLGGGPPDTAAGERRLAGDGITVRRAASSEADAVVQWLRQGPFGGSTWPQEVAVAMAVDPPGCHVAVRGEQYLGFACHGVNRPAWFGPTGTLPEERRHGIGTALLHRCLADMAADGHATAQIAWVGPVRFYARAAGARLDRVFWLYKKAA